MDAPDNSSQSSRAKKVSPGGPYSDRQLDIIGAALWAHFDYAELPDGKGMSWNSIAEAIGEYTGVTMGYEVLRRFAKRHGKNNDQDAQKSSRKTYMQATSNPENIQAIIDYLSHPDIKALFLEELEKEERIDLQPALRLMDYLRQDIDTSYSAPLCWDGKFRTEFKDEDRRTVIELDLDLRMNDGVILVTERRVIFGEEGDARRESRGWAIVTPEDNILFFMKDGPFRRNHYWSMAGDLVTYQFERDRLALLYQDYPPEVGGDTLTSENAMEALQDHAEGNVFLFERVGRWSLSKKTKEQKGNDIR